MKYKRTLTITAITAAIAILAAFGIFSDTTPVHAEDTSPSDMTHLGVPERNVVNLHAHSSGFFYKVERDGLRETTSDYSVPAGKVLIVTDIQTELDGPGGAGAAVLMLIQPTSGGLERHIFRMGEKLDSNGAGRSVVHFTSGLMIGQGHRLRLEHREHRTGRTNISADSRIEGYEVDASPGS